MSEFKISEKPWFAVKPGDNNGYWHINNKYNNFGAIATCYGVLESTAEANAKLIASAPELLEALNNIIGAIDSGLITIVALEEISISSLYNDANKAIKKATEL